MKKWLFSLWLMLALLLSVCMPVAHSLHANQGTAPRVVVNQVVKHLAQSDSGPCVFMTVLFTDNFLVGVRVLGYALQKHHSAHPRYVLITENVSQSVRSQLQADGWQVIIAIPACERVCVYAACVCVLIVLALFFFLSFLYTSSGVLYAIAVASGNH
jgi:hypothetical protein